MAIACVVRKAFPSQRACDASEIARHLSAMPHGIPTACFPVVVGAEELQIPERIHFHPDGYRRTGLSSTQSDMIDCLHTRSHDGFVRERAVRSLSDLNEPWVIPFIIRLVGDYVVEILHAIHERGHELDPRAYHTFLRDNARLSATTASRVVSYWNAYHRSAFPKPSDYVGFQLLAHFDLERAR